jgi:hypothetical protein
MVQTLRPFEIIVCDDHSTDNSWEIICEYATRYPDLVRAHRHHENVGGARNGDFGKRSARGDLVSWLDGDDRWLPRKLEREWQALQSRPEAKIAYSNYYFIDAEGRRTGVWYDGRGAPPPSGEVFIQTFSTHFFPGAAFDFRNQLMERAALAEIGYNDLTIESYSDWDERIRLTARYPVVYSGEALVEYRNHQESLSHRQPLGTQLRTMIKVYEKNLPLLAGRSSVEAAYVTCHLESVVALNQLTLPISERGPRYSARQVHERCCAVLSQLPRNDQEALAHELAPLLFRLKHHAAKEAMEAGDWRLAATWWIACLRYAPRWASQRVRKSCRSWWVKDKF